nr:immunoglobulin light chain junction region [Macaca mulatta]MOV73431.1 immunoglobulin light chain junction region [Macaca mulatta]MOV73583.1 immunoglobulin light chain junction region [Macaca mulatta]MOV74041.1 immunoglobulin light chain junction region [Macaca mulatta]MOV74071.1 immunoglobulin light chain junction region [Macaca mulatta]
DYYCYSSESSADYWVF